MTTASPSTPSTADRGSVRQSRRTTLRSSCACDTEPSTRNATIIATVILVNAQSPSKPFMSTIRDKNQTDSPHFRSDL